MAGGAADVRDPRASGPLVSVIVAAYNAAPFIEATCRSAMRQTHAHLEIIVVDDGSSDDTAAIVSGLSAADPRVRLIRQPNAGVAAARNRALAAASGEFVAPLDADDVWDPTKIERQVGRFASAGADCGLVYSWWVWIDEADHVLDASPRWSIEGRALHRLLEVNFTGSASVPLYRRADLEAIGGFDTTLRDRDAQGCEDYDVALRVAERRSVAVVPKALVGYRRRPDSMSSARDTMWRSQTLVISNLAARHRSIPPRVLRRASGQFAVYLAGVSFWCGDYLDACRWMLRARSIPLVLQIAPAVARLLLGGEPGRSGTVDGDFANLPLPQPRIQYDRIYARRWRRRPPEDPS
jgi:glycosyltransferase involved in cell wall biosynthesis